MEKTMSSSWYRTIIVTLLLGLFLAIPEVAQSQIRGSWRHQEGTASLCEATNYRLEPCWKAFREEDATKGDATKAGAAGHAIPGNMLINSSAVCSEVAGASNIAFSETFTTGPASTYVMVSWSGIGAVDAGVSVNEGVAFQCTVTQGGTTVVCPGTASLPWVVRRSTDGEGNSNLSSYSGLVPGLQANSPTTVMIAFWTHGSSQQICYQNLRIEY